MLRSRPRANWLRAAAWTLVSAAAIAVLARLVPNDLFTAAIGLLVWSLRRQVRIAVGLCVVPALDATI